MAEKEVPQETRRGSFGLFRVAGIEVRIDYSWFLVFLLVAFSLSAGYLPSEYPGESELAYWLTGLAATLLFFLSVLVHELAHSLVAVRSGIQIPDITLFLFGGVSRLSEDAKEPGTELRIAAVGPLASFALAGLFGVLGAWMTESLVAAVVRYLGWINLALGIFNLVPGFPLDGGRILRALWWRRTGSLVEATRVAANLGKSFAVVLMFLGAVQIFAGALLGGVWLIFIGMFLRGIAHANLVDVLLRRSLAGMRVSDLDLEQAVTVPAGLSVQALIDDYFLRLGHHRFLVSNGAGDEQEPLGVVTLERVKTLPKDDRERKTVGEIMAGLDDRNVVRADASVFDILQKFRAGAGGLLVMGANRKIQGILTQGELLRLVEAHQALSR
jgi:Zn-dependent protease